MALAVSSERLNAAAATAALGRNLESTRHLEGKKKQLTGRMLYAKRTNLLSADTWNLAAVKSCR